MMLLFGAAFCKQISVPTLFFNIQYHPTLQMHDLKKNKLKDGFQYCNLVWRVGGSGTHILQDLMCIMQPLQIINLLRINNNTQIRCRNYV